LSQISPVGDAAALVIVEETDGLRLASQRAFALFKALTSSPPSGFVSAVPSFNRVLVQFDPLRTSLEEMQVALSDHLDIARANTDGPRCEWNIPVCYALEHAPDLLAIAARAGLSHAEFVERHSATSYYVYMLGGFPGFPFLGDVPEEICAPRLKNPRLTIPAGSVGIAGNLTCIYPMSTPGGWNLVGATPLALFDATGQEPVHIRPGDQVQFEPISEQEFQSIARSKVWKGKDAWMASCAR
jgi:inhibitor of KinA